MIILIGVTHGKFLSYKEICRKHKLTVQLGDFGFKQGHDWHNVNLDSNSHKVLFGNHDYHPIRNTARHSLGTFGMYNNMFFIAGGKSIDAHLRTEGLDYFSNEELNYNEVNSILDEYTKVKPLVVISHVPPIEVKQELGYREFGEVTDKLFSILLVIHRPTLWIFGHMHKSINMKYGVTQFIGLNELETLTIDENKGTIL